MIHSGQVGRLQRVVDAGADLTIRGTGAPGFHDKTTLDLALAQNQTDLTASLRPDYGSADGGG